MLSFSVLLPVGVQELLDEKKIQLEVSQEAELWLADQGILLPLPFHSILLLSYLSNYSLRNPSY